MYLASSHIVADSPFLQAQPQCNSAKTRKTITLNLHCCKPETVAAAVVVMSTAEFINYQNYNEYYWKGCETFFLFVRKLMQLHTIHLASQGYLFSWDTTFTCPPFSTDLNHMPIYRQFFYSIPRNLKTVFPKFF